MSCVYIAFGNYETIIVPVASVSMSENECLYTYCTLSITSLILCLQTPQDLYSINPGNGIVILEGELNYEELTFYQLEIMARVRLSLRLTRF